MKRALTLLILVGIVSGCADEEDDASPDSGRPDAGETTPDAPHLLPEATPDTVQAAIDGAPVASDTGTPAPDAPVTATQRWYLTCGDPVCRGWSAKPDVPRCNTEKEGNPCAKAGERCDPQSDCNSLLLCAASDPRMNLGGCPRSQREAKRDIRYLGPAELRRYRDDLLGVKLATWRYRQDPARPRLGFIIDDLDPRTSAVAVDSRGEVVDLYGYTSLAVATLQAQEREIAELRRKVRALERSLARGARR